VKYAFMRARDDQFKISRMSAVLKISRSGFYGWRGRKESRRNQENRALLIEVEKVHSQSRQAYGALKTWRELKAQGVKCGRHRVAQLRREAGIEALLKRRFRITTQSRAGMVVAENRLNRSFEVESVNRVWVGDITFIATAAGWLYLSVLLDLYSRRVVGWAMSERIDQQLVIKALQMAILRCRPEPGRDAERTFLIAWTGTIRMCVQNGNCSCRRPAQHMVKIRPRISQLVPFCSIDGFRRLLCSSHSLIFFCRTADLPFYWRGDYGILWYVPC
jgi:hypothetical protein